MTDLTLLTRLPQVRRAVQASFDGALLATSGETDGEALAGVSAFLVAAMTDAGEQFGLGTLRWISVDGEGQAMLVAREEDAVLLGYVEPPRSLAAVEKAVDAAQRKRET
jgi:predicted regulator of Ras-like GTPase activity (Roadblock/LC7/MglB family)